MLSLLSFFLLFYSHPNFLHHKKKEPVCMKNSIWHYHILVLTMHVYLVPWIAVDAE